MLAPTVDAMEADSVADLVRVAAALDIAPAGRVR
jgi:hypothetical protein